jgi:starvation-inducible outer membrane lipoprotein
MKQILLICAVVALVGGCASTPNSLEAKAAIEAKGQAGSAEQIPTEREMRIGEILWDILEILTPLLEHWLNSNISEERNFV